MIYFINNYLPIIDTRFIILSKFIVKIILFNCYIIYSPHMKNFDWENQATSTQRLSTLKRANRVSYSPGVQQQLINQIARVRLVEDELFAQKMKRQTLQRKNIQYIQTIAQLQYTIGDLKFMLDRADIQIKRHSQIDKQIETYAFNLKQVGQQLASLNQILQKKNKQCQKLIQANFKLKEQNTILQQRLKDNQNMKQQQKAKMRELVQIVASESQPSFNQDLMRNMSLIQNGINDLKQNLSSTKGALQKCRKESSQSLIKQKQKIIELQFALKLAQKRNQDLQKKKNMQSSFTIDKKVQDMIEQMLRKQDELTIQIQKLQTQNDILRQNLQAEKQSNQHYMSIKQFQYQKQIKQSKQLFKQLLQEKEHLAEKLQQLSSLKQIQANKSINEQLELSRKYRESNDQNKRLKLKISEIESDKKMLQRQLSLRSFQ